MDLEVRRRSQFFGSHCNRRRIFVLWVRPGSEPNLKTPRRSRSKSKTMLIFFFDRQGIIYHEFFRPTLKARGINGELYLAILKRLRARIARARPELFEEDSWVLHQDNAPSHNCTLVCEWLARNRTIVMWHCPWSPDLAPNDFQAFPRVKKKIWRTSTGGWWRKLNRGLPTPWRHWRWRIPGLLPAMGETLGQVY